MTSENFTLGRRLFAFCFIVLMAVFAVWAGLSEYAALSSLQTRFFMNQWKEDRGINEPAQFDKALAKSHTALVLSPHNADYLLSAANLYEWGAIRYPAWTPEAHSLRSKAIEYYRSAVAHRPSWGSAWAHLAHSKIVDQKFDDETFISFERAMVMAPWAPDVQRKVVWSGIVIWDFMPPEQKDLFIKTINRVLKTPHQIWFLLEVTAYSGWEANLWPLLTEEWQKRNFKKYLKKYQGKRIN